MHRPLLLMLAAALAVLTACDRAAAGPLVDVALVDRDNGQWLPQYPHRGDTWVAGEPGHRYAVRLTNTTGERVLVVLSVDGVNAVTGETADPRQGGYVLDPWESTEITGWRKSLEDVAQFVFTESSDSYAARTGRPRNVGVIGVAVFRERRPMRVMPAPYPPYAETRRQSSPAPAAPASASADAAAAETQSRALGNASAQAQRIGTGHGQREWSPIGTTSFVRATTTPAQLEQIRYDEPWRLIALGIVPDYRHRPRAPQAFPSGFVPDPPR